MNILPELAEEAIVVRGARQNNLRNLDIDIPTRQLIVVTGVSGSGKSSLVFDTLYAEGQRRYVETFSPYARQFLDRMDKPAVDRIDGIPPAIAIDQTNPVRTSRSTVGTMTELNDHLKLLFARAAHLHCSNCDREVRRDSATSIVTDCLQRAAAAPGAPLALVCFEVPIPKNFKAAEVRELLARQGYTRIRSRSARSVEIIQDRLRLNPDSRTRLAESVEAALRIGQGRLRLHLVEAGAAEADLAPALATWRFSQDLHCAECDLAYRDPTPGAFSFNSPSGACETCRGFGRVIGVDYGLVIPDESRTLQAGAIKPWQTESYSECQEDMEKLARKRGIPLDVPFNQLTAAQRRWVIDGEGKWAKNVWYGVRRFFEWLETKAYKMHIRVLLSRYRSYTPCGACDGARLRPESLLWRLGREPAAPGAPRFRPKGVKLDDAAMRALPGLCLHDLMLRPLSEVRQFMDGLRLPGELDAATDLLLAEIRSRLRFLNETGLGYLTLDRQSRTLSGGEVQRINLTTALGTSLVNTLFVLDEPSIGLHPRDMQRVIDVMHRLRDAGNSLVIVEHDPQIMLEADRILDMGPGAGERGGQIVCFDTPAGVRSHPQSLTGAWLSGRRQLAARPRPQQATGAASTRWLHLRGAAEHNLQQIDVSIPLGQRVCITGVSGSGKSTLVQDVLYPALRKAKGQPAETPGAFAALEGAELIEAAVLVDQTPIGRTTRSNPASFVGAFDVIRERFAKLPLARERRYTASTFSFNAGTGRCPACGGNGFEHVEMQFLSDVYLRCGECDGKRYRAETLEVRDRGSDGREASIADVLQMTITEALAFYADSAELARRLQPLLDVGLDYLKLGQPVPTLSGGEAQRLKLAGFLAESAVATARGRLFLFDEPTTGLHFEDVARLLGAFDKLIAAGHSLVIVEHNLDVIGAADWLIDLGPEGGAGGGRVVAAGTPDAVALMPGSHTGRALAHYRRNVGVAESPGHFGAQAPGPAARQHGAPQISVRAAREHNLKNIDVLIPRERFTVLTGVSGSGKSTLAFDILFNEGQRRYLESLNAYARQFVQPASRPDVDAIFGIPPTVAIEQRTSRGGIKSTVATLTEIYHFLRLLYVRLGTQFCPRCDLAIEPQTPESLLARVLHEFRGRNVLVLAPLVSARKGLYTDLAKWAAAKGYPQLRVDGALVAVKPFARLDRFKDHDIELPVAQLRVTADAETPLREALSRALEFGKGVVRIVAAGDSGQARIYSTRRACPSCGDSFAELDPRLLSFNSSVGWCVDCTGTGLAGGAPVASKRDAEQNASERIAREIARETATTADAAAGGPCESCNGQRLNPIALHVRFRARSIGALTCEPIDAVARFFGSLKLNARETAIARDLLGEIRGRLQFLARVGLGYLQLDRAAPTLSGGESQRIRLAAQLGSNLRGVCYVLDEPTIGLHPRDNAVLLEALSALAANRNTLIVVEHDEDTILRADHVIDLGPGAGVRGGEVVAQGTAADLMRTPASITGRFLREPAPHPAAPRRRVRRDTPAIEIEAADLHNLARVDVRIPLGRLTVITGVSGSGKSTLARDVLFSNASAPTAARVGCRAIRGLEAVDRVLEVDQTPIGKTPRSTPATYVGIWDDIRRIFAGATESKLRGYTPTRFSFNSGDGRCAGCEGQGTRTIEMSFLPDVKVLCDVCGGRRFNRETLDVQWGGLTIADVLQLNIEAALDVFGAHSGVHGTLTLLAEVGLGYLTLGQQSPTLSGGEAQRLKLVTELAKVRTQALPRPGARASRAPHTLYVLDEPTVGLHMADVQKLVAVLHRLVDAGNTVVVVEHNLDVMAEADWLIDMGPEAGAGGGRVVAKGTPQDLSGSAPIRARSHTAAALAGLLGRRTNGSRD